MWAPLLFLLYFQLYNHCGGVALAFVQVLHRLPYGIGMSAGEAAWILTYVAVVGIRVELCKNAG